MSGVSGNTVFIALPAFGQVNCTKTTFSLMALAKALLANGYDYYFSDNSYPDIAESRNMFATIWYDRTDADYLLFTDADMQFEPQLVLDMLAFGEPLVGCMYPVKSYPLKFVGRELPGPKQFRDGFLKREGIGFGVTLIRRDCLQAMLDRNEAKSDTRLERHAMGELLRSFGINRLIRAFDEIETESGKLSEDHSFCLRHRNCGGEVWAATHHTITHIGLHGYSGCYADGLKQQRGVHVQFTANLVQPLSAVQ